MDRQSINYELRRFSSALVPTDEFVRSRSEYADKILTFLSGYSGTSSTILDGVKFLGTTGRAADTCVEPDFDFVEYMNPRSSQSGDFGNTNTQHAAHENIKYISAEFTRDNVCFNVFPATSSVTLVQPTTTQDEIHSTPMEVEQMFRFVNGQSPFVHELIRLARFWNKTLHFDMEISGRIYMIELIAIYAGRAQEAKGNMSCLDAFDSFLRLIANFRNLQVKFSTFYNESMIPVYINVQRPLVLDPVNPQRNFALFPADKRNRIVGLFSRFAEESIDRWNKGRRLSLLFGIQPEVIPGHIRQPNKWLVDIMFKILLNPKLVVRLSEDEFKAKQWNVKALQNCLITNLATLGAECTITNCDFRSLALHFEDTVKRIVDFQVLGFLGSREDLTWSSLKGHEDHDFSLFLPIPGFENLCVKLSASW